MLDPKAIRERIEEVAKDEAGLSASMASDVAFHLTDWLNDLGAFVEFCEAPASRTPDEINSMLIGFLLHAPNHIAAAAKLYVDFPVVDVFGVGSVGSSNEAVSLPTQVQIDASLFLADGAALGRISGSLEFHIVPRVGEILSLLFNPSGLVVPSSAAPLLHPKVVDILHSPGPKGMVMLTLDDVVADNLSVARELVEYLEAAFDLFFEPYGEIFVKGQ